MFYPFPSTKCQFFKGDLSYHMTLQVSAYEACDRTRTPLHTPKNVRDVLKKACLVWLKKLQGVRQIARLKQLFYLFLNYNTKILQENHLCLCVIWLLQWWKLCYIHIFFTQRTTDLGRLKRNMDDGTIVFLTSLLTSLTWNILILFSFWQKIISCFK